MTKPPTHLKRGRTVRETIDRWKEHLARRMRARDPNRPPWNRPRFLEEFRADHPGDPRAIGFADAFEAAIAEAHGSDARFKQALNRILTLSNWWHKFVIAS